MYQQYRLAGSKGYLVHTCIIPSVVEWILAYMDKFGCLGSQKRRRPSGRLSFYGSQDPAPYVPAISAPWAKGLFGTHMLHTLCCGMNIGVYGQVWGALVLRNEGVPLAGRLWFYGSQDPAPYVPAISAPWVKGLFGTHLLQTLCCGMKKKRILPSLGCLGSQKRRRPSGRLWFYGSLDPAPYVPAISAPWAKGLFGTHMLHNLCCGMNICIYGQVWGALVPKMKASLWQIVILWQPGTCTLCTSNIGSLGQRAIWYTHVTNHLWWNEYWRIWPSLGCLSSQKRRRPSGRLWFYGSLDPAPYVPAISAPWVKGLFGTHLLQTLCCGMNNGIYGQV